MILEHVVLENVRSHKRTEIEFERGITLLSGDVGSGKSSILMAIEFALFGLGPQKADALLSKRASSASVELRFSIDGKRYDIRRALKKTESKVSQDPKDSQLYIDGQKQTLSTIEMKQRVMEILHFDEPRGNRAISNIFRYAVFTPQEEMKAILYEPTKRLDTVRRAFGIEEYKTAGDNAKMVAAEISRRAAEFRGRAAGAKEIAEKIEACEKRLRDSEGQLAEERGKAGRISDELVALKAEREKTAKLESDKAALDRKMAGAEAAIAEKTRTRASLEAEIAKDEAEEADASEKIRLHRTPEKPTEMSADEIDSKIWEMAQAEKESAGAQARGRAAADEIAKIDSEMGDCAGAGAAALQSEIAEAKSAVEAARKTQEGAEKRAQEAEYASRQHAKEISQLDEASLGALREGAKCPVCENVITGDHLQRLEKERGEKRARLESDAARAGQDKGRASAEAEKARVEAEFHERRAELASRMAELASRRAEKSAEIAQAEARVSELEKTGSADSMRELRTKLSEYAQALRTRDMLGERLESARSDAQRHRAELSSVQDGLAQAEAEKAKVAAGLEKFSGLDAKAASLDAELSEKHDQSARAQASLASRERDVANDRDSLERDRASLEEAQKWDRERSRHEDYATWLTDFFAAAMPAIERRVMRDAWAGFNEAYRGWYAKLVDDHTKESMIDEEFSPRVNQDGLEQDVSYMSGGERTGVALAYRLALNSVLRKNAEVLKSSLLILDEPTDGFSADQMIKIKDILDELDSEQIIMVSHDSNLEGFAQHVVRIRRDGDYSRAEPSPR